MAKKVKINKTQAVADYMKTHKKAKASEIAAALDKKGIKISAGHAANIKSRIKRIQRAKMTAKASPATAATAAAGAEQPAAAKPGDALTVQHIKVVAEAVRAIGGFGRMRELLDVIREVGGLKRFKDLSEAMAAIETHDIKFS
jgi:hypothetical protein